MAPRPPAGDTGFLAGHRVVVTGGGRGLGLAMARRLGQAGAAVILAEVEEDRGRQASSGLRGEGIDAHAVPMDVTDPGSVETATRKILEDGPVDALINNAALADGVGGKPFYDLTVDEWDRVMTVNARGPWLVSRTFAAHMMERSRGRIVNIASDAALYGSPRLAHYIASKGAVISMTRSMARDLGPFGVTVNAVAPGLSDTESAQRIPEERHALYRDNRAIQRVQRPEDTAGMVAFLVGPEADYITGQLFVVNGGFVLH